MQSQGKIPLRKMRKINHLLFMDDLKLYGKTESEIKGLVSTVEVCSQDVDMEISI